MGSVTGEGAAGPTRRQVLIVTSSGREKQRGASVAWKGGEELWYQHSPQPARIKHLLGSIKQHNSSERQQWCRMLARCPLSKRRGKTEILQLPQLCSILSIISDTLSKADGCVNGINSYFVISDNLCYYNVPRSGKGTETLMVFTVYACLTTDCKSSWIFSVEQLILREGRGV